MPTIGLFDNTKEIADLVRAIGTNQAPFGIANGLNRTALEARDAQRNKLPSQFTIRSGKSRRFLERFVSINREDYARKNKLDVTVGIQDQRTGASGTSKASILAKFEQAGQRAATGGGLIAIPSSTLRKGNAAIPQRMYPGSLGLAGYRQIEGGSKIRGLVRTKKGKYLLKGKRRTFGIDPLFQPSAPRNVWGIYQRRGRRGDTEPFLLWVLRHTVRHPKRISFVDDTRRLVNERLGKNVEGQMLAARDELKQFRARAQERVARSRGLRLR